MNTFDKRYNLIFQELLKDNPELIFQASFKDWTKSTLLALLVNAGIIGGMYASSNSDIQQKIQNMDQKTRYEAIQLAKTDKAAFVEDMKQKLDISNEQLAQPEVQPLAIDIEEETYLDGAYQLIKNFESSYIVDGMHMVYDDAVLNKYWDGKSDLQKFIDSCIGTPTIGYGLTAKKFVNKGKITEEQAYAEMVKHVNAVDTYLTDVLGGTYTNLNKNQKMSLLSLYYNLGSISKTPKLIAALKAGNKKEVAKQFLDCNRYKGEVNDGLTKRRIAESKLFLTKVND